MRVEIPDFGSDDLRAKSASFKIEWKADKEGELYLAFSASAQCELKSGGTITPKQTISCDISDSQACDVIRAFKRVAEIVGLQVNVETDLANEQKPLFGGGPSAN